MKKGEFKFTILPEKDKDLKLEIEKYPSIHIFTDDKYYDNTYSGKVIYNRLKKHLMIKYAYVIIIYLLVTLTIFSVVTSTKVYDYRDVS